jgi:AcrR family transcriptional regulator
MPPKFKLTKDQIIGAAMEIAGESGIEAVTARELGIRLGVSSRPIYSVYESMEELKREVVKRVFRHFAAEMMVKGESDDPFLCSGINYINYAKKYRQFYRITNVTGHKYHGKEEEQMHIQMIENMRNQPHYSEFTHEEMHDLLTKMWIFSHGLADLVSQGTIPEFNDAFALRMMQEVGEAVIRFKLMLKKGEVQSCTSPVETVVKKKK